LGDAGIDLGALCRGDKPAWDAFVRRYAAVIQAAVRRLVRAAGREEADVGDLVQDVFLRLCKDGFRLMRTYDQARASLPTWLTVVARSTAMDAMRRRMPLRVALDDVPEAVLGVTEPVTSNEPAALPLDDLPPRQRLILTLLFERDMDVAEVAQMLDLDPQTVRSMKHKALTRLRAQLGVAGRAAAGGRG
jgi:RNA polymerase sigma factor (sigma-70 family)